MYRSVSKHGYQHSVGSAPFERMAAQYDSWFESDKGSRIFQVEAECLRQLMIEMPRPCLEVGVGTGRFASALDIDVGIDPSPAVLRYASDRGISTRTGKAEELPFKNKEFGAVLLVVTICFLNEPLRALKECRRILRNDGYLIIGLVPKDSAWGKIYAKKGAEGHPFYSSARFYTAHQIIKKAEQSGFDLNRATSCLFERPNQRVSRYRRPREGLVKNAGFVGLRFGERTSSSEKEKGNQNG